MPRHWSSRSPLKSILPIALLAAAGIYWWMQRQVKREPFPGTARLDVSAYTTQPAALRGQVFTVRGTVDQTLANAGDSAERMIVVLTGSAENRGGRGEPLSLKVPGSLAGRMQAGREFYFKVTVGHASVLIVQDLAEI
jgi:hypothetical protein